MWSVYTNRSKTDHPFSFADLLTLQDKILSQIMPEQGQALLFSELRPTVTLGARQMADEKQQESVELLSQHLRDAGIDVHSGERGGNETWHGPGQWVCFVLSPLEKFTGDSKGVRKGVHLLLEKVLKLVQEYIPEARIEEGDRLGIWSDRGKVVSVGIKIRSGYMTSGFAVNCIPHPKSFYGINPCGIKNALPDFLFKDRVEKGRWDSEFETLPERLSKLF